MPRLDDGTPEGRLRVFMEDLTAKDATVDVLTMSEDHPLKLRLRQLKARHHFTARHRGGVAQCQENLCASASRILRGYLSEYAEKDPRLL